MDQQEMEQGRFSASLAERKTHKSSTSRMIELKRGLRKEVSERGVAGFIVMRGAEATDHPPPEVDCS